MAKQIAMSKLVLVIDWTAATQQVLNAYTVNDPTQPTLTLDDSLAYRNISAAELNGTLGNFLQGLLQEAQTNAGV